MKPFIFFLAAILCSVFVQAQSPVGKWKFYSYTMEARDGTKTDVLKDFTKEHPCLKNVLVIFTTDGKLRDQADNCPADIQQLNLGTQWKMPSKNKIAILLDETDKDPVIYNFEIVGDKMRWTIDYDAKDSKDIKQLLAVFVKA